MSEKQKPGVTGGWLVAPAMVWLALFALAPLVFLVTVSFWTASMFGLTSSFSLQSYAALAGDSIYIRVLGNTVKIAVITTALSLLVSYPIALFLASLKGKRKMLFVILLFLPFWTSYVVRTFVWMPILGRSGLINATLMSMGVIDRPLDNLVFNEGAVYLGLVYVYTLYMTLPIYLALDKLDPALIEAANDLGASAWQTFRKIILPLTLPAVWSGCTMVFLLCCGAFVTPRLLGGPSSQMFGNIISSQFLDAGNWPLGAALSVVLMVVVMLSLYLASRRFGFQSLFMGRH
jgi:spermidine/putrescine transport system permease protein